MNVKVKNNKIMCLRIIVNEGELEIETPNQFLDYFGTLPIPYEDYKDEILDCCLCNWDIEKSLIENDFNFKEDDSGDFYINGLTIESLKKIVIDMPKNPRILKDAKFEMNNKDD